MTINKNMIIITNIAMLLFPMPFFNNNTYNSLVDKVIPTTSEIELKINNIIDNYDIPHISGPVANLPWRNNKDFLKAKEKHNTPNLLAAFCSVLKNPLPGEEYNVSFASKNITGKVIKPDKVFSQNATIGPYTNSKGYKTGASYSGGEIVMTEGGGVCKIATTLYNLVALSDLEVVERHNHSMPNNYVPYGQDATVAYGVKDFRFKNNSNGNILIWAELIGNRLYMGFYGNGNPPKIEWNHETNNIVEPSVKYIKNEELKKGEMNIRIPGMNGAQVKSTLTIIYNDGTIKTKKMKDSNYIPLPRIIEIN